MFHVQMIRSIHSRQATWHVWFCSPRLPLSPLFSALPAPRYTRAKARWWRRWVNIFTGLVEFFCKYLYVQAGLVCLCAVLCLVFLLWLLLTVRYHCQVSKFPTSHSSFFAISSSGLAQVEKRSPRNPTTRKLSEENKEFSGTNYTQSKYGWCKGRCGCWKRSCSGTTRWAYPSTTPSYILDSWIKLCVLVSEGASLPSPKSGPPTQCPSPTRLEVKGSARLSFAQFQQLLGGYTLSSSRASSSSC